MMVVVSVTVFTTACSTPASTLEVVDVALAVDAVVVVDCDPAAEVSGFFPGFFLPPP